MNKIFTYWANFSTLILLVISSYCHSAEQVMLSQLAELTDFAEQSVIEISAIPNQNNSYFVASKQGIVKRIIDGNVNPSTVLDVKAVLPKVLAVTAFTLHPNFAIREQPGFATFYTAHIEPLNTARKYARLEDTQATLAFDTIINEWQLDDNGSIDIASKREVIRIGVPSNAVTIEQLAFSPFSKVWNDDFGLLYIGLTHDHDYASLPLYSGVILRINPQRFGLRNYTTPTTNPFLTSSAINDEILMLGLQEFHHFVWPYKDNSQLLVNHRYNDQQLLSLTSQKNDWRNVMPSNIVHQQEQTIDKHQLFVYRGKSLSQLWGSLIFVTQENHDRQLTSLTLSATKDSAAVPTVIATYPSAHNEDNSDLLLFGDNKGELLMFNNGSQILSLLIDNLAAVTQQQEGVADSPLVDGVANEELLNWLILISLLAIAGFLYHQNKKKRLSARFIVKQQFSRMEISESKHQVSLFHQQQKVPSNIVEITKLAESKISLNNLEIVNINRENGFDDSKEIDLREHFSKERREKMVTDRVRQITINLTSVDGECFPICLYLRKGDQRVTRKRFQNAIDDVINWCWLVSEVIAPAHTGERKLIPVHEDEPSEKAPPQASASKQQSTKLTSEEQPIVNQLDEHATHHIAVDSSAHDSNDNSTVSDKEPSSPPAETVTPVPKVKVATPASDSTNTVKAPNTASASDYGKLDTELVNAIEKLVNLKAQGVLSEQQFEQAKNRLLKHLTDKS